MNHVKLYKGNFPDPEFYLYIGRHGNWKVYSSKKMNERGLYSIKVLSLDKKPKANFYLSFSVSEKRILMSSEWRKFTAFNPEDEQGVTKVVLEYFRNLENKENPL